VQARYVAGKGNNVSISVKEGSTMDKGPDATLQLNAGID